jgi:hypothetical protein
MDVYFKTLVFNNGWVDLAKLDTGIYLSTAPCLISKNVKDIDEFIENRRKFYAQLGRVMPVAVETNLRDCKLIDIEIKKCSNV